MGGYVSWKSLVAVVLMVALVSACDQSGSTGSPNTSTASASVIDTPNKKLFGIEWTKPDSVILVYTEHSTGVRFVDQVSLLGFNLGTATYEPLASVEGVRGPAGQIGVSPDGTRFLVAMGSLCGVIVEATAQGAKPLNVTVSDGPHSFSLADTAPGPDCSQRGWANYPTWSPTDNVIAFFAAPGAIGESGPARGSVPANLYVMSPDGSVATSILNDVTVPRALKFSPDGRFLAFGGEIGGVKATWVLERATGVVRQVHNQRFEWLAWSPDGQQLAGLQVGSDPSLLEDDLVVVPVAVN
jgi:WD40 repeat protein